MGLEVAGIQSRQTTTGYPLRVGCSMPESRRSGFRSNPAQTTVRSEFLRIPGSPRPVNRLSQNAATLRLSPSTDTPSRSSGLGARKPGNAGSAESQWTARAATATQRSGRREAAPERSAGKGCRRYEEGFSSTGPSAGPFSTEPESPGAASLSFVSFDAAFADSAAVASAPAAPSLWPPLI